MVITNSISSSNPNVKFLLVQISVISGTWHVTINLSNTFFYNHTKKEDQKELTCSGKRQ
jgi:hypothetical protein